MATIDKSLPNTKTEIEIPGEEVIVEQQEKLVETEEGKETDITCLLYTSPSPRDRTGSRMPSSA